MTKVACYIDGFNLYHAIHDLKKPHLKWVDLWRVAQSLCRDGETLEKVAYFSAYATWMPDKYARHRKYVAALKATGVECHLARFSEKTALCKACGSSWKRREEKETDVHFALTFLEDAIDGQFQRALIISADSDYVPAVRAVKRRLPLIEVFLAAPPKRYRLARDMLTACDAGVEITHGRLAKCLLPREVRFPDGSIAATRPIEYELT